MDNEQGSPEIESLLNEIEKVAGLFNKVIPVQQNEYHKAIMIRAVAYLNATKMAVNDARHFIGVSNVEG